MNIYGFIGVSIGLFAFNEVMISNRSPRKSSISLLLYVLISFCAIIFVGFRECGFDYQNYYRYFIDLSSASWKANADYLNVEYGYAYLNYILGDYKLVLVVMAVATIALQFKFIYKYSPFPFFSLFLFLGVMLYPIIMGQFRQALAIGLILWAFTNKENKLLFLIIILLAATFHASALIALFALFIPNKVFKTTVYLLLLLIALGMNFIMESYMLSMAKVLPALIGSKIETYSTIEDYVLGLNTAMLLRIIIFLIFIFYKDKLNRESKEYYFLNLYFVSLFIYLALGAIPQIAGRGSIYFYFFEFILASIVLSRIKGYTRFVLFCFFIGISIYRQVGFFSQWQSDYIPYANSLFN